MSPFWRQIRCLNRPTHTTKNNARWYVPGLNLKPILVFLNHGVHVARELSPGPCVQASDWCPSCIRDAPSHEDRFLFSFQAELSWSNVLYDIPVVCLSLHTSQPLKATVSPRKLRLQPRRSPRRSPSPRRRRRTKRRRRRGSPPRSLPLLPAQLRRRWRPPVRCRPR